MSRPTPQQVDHQLYRFLPPMVKDFPHVRLSVNLCQISTFGVAAGRNRLRSP
jgi:hypothetical protein